MSTHRAMKQLAESPDAIRALARYLQARGSGEAPVAWTDWELDFLDSMASRDTPEPLSMRQREILTDLRNAAERHASIDGFSVRGLLDRCWAERCELADDDDIAFIEALKASGLTSISRRQLGRLLACCRELGIIEAHHGFIRPAYTPEHQQR